MTPPRLRIVSARWVGPARSGHLSILDQTLLPAVERRRELRTVDQAIEAIRKLRVRGAPLIGITAAYAMVLAARDRKSVV